MTKEEMDCGNVPVSLAAPNGLGKTFATGGGA